jgi:dipeptidyl aminopeptidase/acylaminoacyl peptidase
MLKSFLDSLKRSVAGTAALLAALASQLLAAQAIPVERFMQLPAFARPSLSPDAKSVAVLARSRGRLNLILYELDSKKAVALTNFDDQDVISAHWVNDRRIVFSVGDYFDPSNFSGARSGGLYAVDRDGQQFRRLAQSVREALSSGAFVIRSVGFASSAQDNSDDIYVFSNERSIDSYDLYRMNSRSGRKTLLTPKSPTAANFWIVDQNDVPRIAGGVDKLNAQMFYRADENAAWQKVHDADFRQPGTTPMGVDYDNKTIYAFSNVGRDASALVQWDPVKNAVTRVLFERAGADMQELVWDRVGKKLAGVRFMSDRAQVHWLDETWRNVQRAIDNALPNAVNAFSPPAQGKRFLVHSYADRNPGSYYLFDGETRKLEFLFDSRPDLKAEQLSETRPVRYAARDGLPIPALLTVPRGSDGKNLPLVVYVQGGPWAPATTWSFDAISQFFASRGYAVLRPNFRGTIGLGTKHLNASYKQWGGTMQDDITDGVQWAVKQGIADGRRVCIFGGSYGGYAAMQGLAKTPDLYRCGINMVGVTDLLLLQTATWSDSSETEFMKYRAPVMVGDLDADRVMLVERSPARNAEKITAPVLMFYGGADRRVPIEHGTRMFDALKRAGAGDRVHMEVFQEEGHSFSKLENRVKAFTMMEAFLRESLK